MVAISKAFQLNVSRFAMKKEALTSDSRESESISEVACMYNFVSLPTKRS